MATSPAIGQTVVSPTGSKHTIVKLGQNSVAIHPPFLTWQTVARVVLAREWSLA